LEQHRNNLRDQRSATARRHIGCGSRQQTP
jgi:hypothetical protein